MRAAIVRFARGVGEDRRDIARAGRGRSTRGVSDVGVRAKWRNAGAGQRYAEARWSSAAKRARDPRQIATLLARHLPRNAAVRVLDAPCGAGRLAAALAEHGAYVGLDVSPSMLATARAALGPRAQLLLGDATALPFRDGAFGAVVCCRLLHHLAERAELERVVAELVRVSRTLVIASFWDAGSLPAWRRRVFPGRAPRRHARARAELAAAFTRAGAEVLAFEHPLRFLTRQAYVVARKRAPS
jgi:SAM-dependent methyltransferase